MKISPLQNQTVLLQSATGREAVPRVTEPREVQERRKSRPREPDFESKVSKWRVSASISMEQSGVLNESAPCLRSGFASHTSFESGSDVRAVPSREY